MALQLRSVAKQAVRSPGSRLSDDLYRLYLAGLGWLIFPIYGEGFAAALPTSESTMRWVFPIAAVCAQLGWLWSGARGGPMMVTRASLIHELGGPVSPRTVLAPQLLRQAMAWGVGGALVGGVLTSLGGSYSFSAAFSASAAGFLLSFASVAWALTVMVGVRSDGSLRTSYLASAVVAALVAVVTVLVTVSITTPIVLAVLLALAIAGAALAWHALSSIPVQTLWERSRNLESARSAMLEVDFHRMMIDVRSAGEGKPSGATRLPGRSLSWWRCLAPLRHSMPWSALRLAAATIAGLLLVAFAPLDQGVVLVAVGAVWLVVGYELTRGLAAIADQISFFVHYPRSSFPLLVGQLITSLGLGAALVALVNGWRLPIDRTAGFAAVLVAAMGIVGGAMQARLGSPDTTKFVSNYGLQNAAAMLWARAALAPLAVLVVAVLVFHGFLEPLDLGPDVDVDFTGPIRVLIAILFAGSLGICLMPLKRVAR